MKKAKRKYTKHKNKILKPGKYTIAVLTPAAGKPNSKVGDMNDLYKALKRIGRFIKKENKNTTKVILKAIGKIKAAEPHQDGEGKLLLKALAKKNKQEARKTIRETKRAAREAAKQDKRLAREAARQQRIEAKTAKKNAKIAVREERRNIRKVKREEARAAKETARTARKEAKLKVKQDKIQARELKRAQKRMKKKFKSAGPLALGDMINLSSLAMQINENAREDRQAGSPAELLARFHEKITAVHQATITAGAMDMIEPTYVEADGTRLDSGRPEGVPIAMADLIIQALDFCGQYGIDIQTALQVKIAYDQSRPRTKRGKKMRGE